MKKTPRRVLALFLALVMALSVFSISATAAVENYNADYQSDTHTVFKHTEQTLAPGVTYYNNYAYSSDNKQMVYYVATADLNNPDVVVQTSYKNQYNDGNGLMRVTDQIAYANGYYTDADASGDRFISEYYNVVAGCNASFFNMSTGQPTGVCILDGQSISESPKSYPCFFMVDNNGVASVHKIADYDACYAAGISQAVAGSQLIVWEGQDVTANASGDYNLDRHSRTCIGVTADNQVVIMTLDGRQEPFSCGGSMHELAQIMLEAGCVAAINLDGGGSSTFVTRPEGEESVKVVNRPSDGSERSVSSGIIIASTAVPTNTFDHVSIVPSSEYVTPNSTVDLDITGVSPVGSSAEIPADITYSATLGDVVNGQFVSDGNVGDAVITAYYEGAEVGSATIHIATPVRVEFATPEMTLSYGKTTELLFTAYCDDIHALTVKEDDFTFEISNPTVGSFNGFYFTAGDQESATAASGIITMTSVYDPSVSANLTMNLGQGSVVVYDFEGFDASTLTAWWTGGDHQEGYVEVVTPETGKVRNGNNALAINYDYSNNPSAGHHRLAVKGFDIDFTNAVSMSAWVYIPGDANAYRLYVTDSKDAGSNKGKNIRASFIGDNEIGSGRKYSQDGWYYITTTIPALPAGTTPVFVIKANDSYDGTNKYLDWNPYQRGTFYIDDITLNYSSALEDTDPPVFSSVIYNTTNMIDGVELNGQTVTDNCVSFRARVAEDTTRNNYVGLDTNSIKAYIDGQEAAFTFSGGDIVIKDAVLSKGVHTVKFVAADKNGNENYVERKINVDAENYSILFEQEGNASEDVLCGSIVWFDLKAKNIENIQSVTTTIDLDSVNDWEFDGMETLYGFEADYSIAERTNTATITFNKVDEVDASGEAVLARIPVRMWRYCYHEISGLPLSDTPTDVDSYQTLAATPTAAWHSDGNRRVAIIIEVKAGSVTLADGSADTFGSSVITIGSESKYWREENRNVGGTDAYANKEHLHQHTAHAIEDKDPTCTESGYLGRTFCDECNSVVDWGTVIPTSGHRYVIDAEDGLMKCEFCEKLFTGEIDGKYYTEGVALQGFVDGKYYIDGALQPYTGVVKVEDYYFEFDETHTAIGKYTGVFEKDGKYYYAQFGELSSGWKMIDDEWYYFDATTMNPVQTLNNGKVTFEFEENGKLVSGKWYISSAGRRYYYGPSYYKHGWETIDGDEYYFGDANKNPGYCYTGKRYVINSNSYTPQWYDFGEEGKAVKITSTGFLTTDEGTYYLVDGVSQTGLQLIDGKYYYFTNSYAARSGLENITEAKSNDLLPAGYYLFGEDYAMVDGEFAMWQGTMRYIKLGQPYFAGVMKDENGIYYIGSGATIKNGLITVANGKGNGILEDGTYLFGEDNYLTDNAFGYWQGNYVYFKDGQPYAAGPVEVEGEKYYIRSNCQPAKGLYYVSASKANDILSEGYYLFDSETGALVDGEFGQWQGAERYIKNGQPCFAGVIEYEGDLIYIGSDCTKKTGVNYVSEDKTNGNVSAGYYLFDEDGVIVWEGFGVWTDGNTYYFKDGQRTAAGVVNVDGNIYYIKGSCRPATGKCYVSAAKGNGILEEGYYTFGEDGVLVTE